MDRLKGVVNMNAIFCNANILMDVSLIKKLREAGMNFVLITATEEIRYTLKRYYDIDAGSLDEHRMLDIYNHSSIPKYKYGNSEYLSILDRYKVVGDLTIDKKYVFFNNAFDHWNAFLADHHVGFAVFKMTPHLLYDFVIHELCEEKGIKKVIIEKTYWEDIVLLQRTFRYGDFIKNVDGIESIQDITPQIKVKKMPYWTEAKIANQKGDEERTENVSGLKRLKNLVHESINVPVIREYGFYDGEYMSAGEVRRYNRLKQLGVRGKIRRINNEIIDEYNRYLVDYEKIRNGKNIVFYLQCQPEKSTSPLGGKYSDQLLAIKDFIDWMPAGYQLLVKEHPSQFTQWQSLDKGRFPGFYKKITDMGCSLISHKLDNLKLFESTALTISITGTIVFEAWTLGYKAAFLGFPWYRLFDIKKVASKQDVDTVLKEMETDSTYCEKIRALSSMGFKGYADEFSETKFLIENNMRLAADQMAHGINQYAIAG
jgi:hypothetical protein